MTANVLFVDDEPAVLEGIRNVLRREPYRIFLANSGADALALFDSTSIDVIVSDEEMPGMRGTELLARVRHAHPTTIRLVLTGRGSLEHAVRAINEGGVYRYLTKPCDPAVLSSTVRSAIETKRLTDENAEILAAARVDRTRLLAALARMRDGASSEPPANNAAPR
jgi:DNA-binding NtrC family response regulator